VDNKPGCLHSVLLLVFHSRIRSFFLAELEPESASNRRVGESSQFSTTWPLFPHLAGRVSASGWDGLVQVLPSSNGFLFGC